MQGGVVLHQAVDIFIGDAIGLRGIANDVGRARRSAQLIVGVLHLQNGSSGRVLLPCEDEKCVARTG